MPPPTSNAGYDVVAGRIMVLSLELDDDGTLFWAVEDAEGIARQGRHRGRA